MNLCFPLQLPISWCVLELGCRLRCTTLGSRATGRASLQATRVKLRAETLAPEAELPSRGGLLLHSAQTSSLGIIIVTGGDTVITRCWVEGG